jgi:Holliday junction resolvase
MNKNKNYVKGRAFEYKIATLFRRKGYYVVRSAGSYGPSDLVAVKKGQRPVLIQCKAGAAAISKEESDLLFLTAKDADSIPIVVSKEDRTLTIYTQLVGLSSEPGEGKRVVKASDF